MRAAVLALLALVASAELPAEDANTSGVEFLVTFVNSGGQRAGPAAQGRYYRFRSRYEVSRVAESSARAIEREYGVTLVDDWPIDSLGVYCVVYRAGEPATLPALLERLARDPRVESAQVMVAFESTTNPGTEYNDSYAAYQHGFESMGIGDAHRIATGEGVTIAVVDTEVDVDHEDLSRRGIKSVRVVDSGVTRDATAHGTAVVSVIAARPNNGKGIAGVAPSARMIAVSACWTNPDSEAARCNTFTLAKAMDHLLSSPPDVLNFSIAGPHDPLFGRLVDKAIERGIVVVAARPVSAGNDGIYPASYPGVLGVRSGAFETTEPGALIAPGEQIMVALPNDSYDYRSGSSLAAAHASGVIALLLSQAPGLSSERIAAALLSSQAGSTNGPGVIHACRALTDIGIVGECR